MGKRGRNWVVLDLDWISSGQYYVERAQLTKTENYTAIFPSLCQGATPTSNGLEVARADLQPLVVGRPRGQSTDPWLDSSAWWCAILSTSVPLQPGPPSLRVYRQRVCTTASASSTTAVHPRLRLPSRVWSHPARSAVIPLQCLGLGLGNPLAQASCMHSSRLKLSCRPRSWTSSQPCLQLARFQRTKESLHSSDDEEGGHGATLIQSRSWKERMGHAERSEAAQASGATWKHGSMVS